MRRAFLITIWQFYSKHDYDGSNGFTFWIGVRADQSVRKGRAMIVVGVIQAVLFSLVVLWFKIKPFWLFQSFVLLISLQMFWVIMRLAWECSILQHNLDKDDLFEAYVIYLNLSLYLSSILVKVLWRLAVDGFLIITFPWLLLSMPCLSPYLPWSL